MTNICRDICIDAFLKPEHGDEGIIDRVQRPKHLHLLHAHVDLDPRLVGENIELKP